MIQDMMKTLEGYAIHLVKHKHLWKPDYTREPGTLCPEYGLQSGGLDLRLTAAVGLAEFRASAGEGIFFLLMGDSPLRPLYLTMKNGRLYDVSGRIGKQGLAEVWVQYEKLKLKADKLFEITYAAQSHLH